jgi:hypothetical protein
LRRQKRESTATAWSMAALETMRPSLVYGTARGTVEAAQRLKGLSSSYQL